jgi:hypothetical protein
LIDRRFEGVVGGAAVKLNPPLDGLLCVAEGVETAMAVQQLAIGPTWALGSSEAVAAFPVLPKISTLIISEEKDEASSTSAGECARRWLGAGCDVTFAKPSGKGDLNDTLIFNGKFTIKPFKVYRNV